MEKYRKFDRHGMILKVKIMEIFAQKKDNLKCNVDDFHSILSI